MNDIKALNQELAMTHEEMEEVITELMEREAYACTGDACGIHGCGVN